MYVIPNIYDGYNYLRMPWLKQILGSKGGQNDVKDVLVSIGSYQINFNELKI